MFKSFDSENYEINALYKHTFFNKDLNNFIKSTFQFSDTCVDIIFNMSWIRNSIKRKRENKINSSSFDFQSKQYDFIPNILRKRKSTENGMY